MRDIPVWLLVLVGMVGVSALSLLVYLLLPRRSAVVEPAEADPPPAPERVAEQPAPAAPGSEPPAQDIDWPAPIGVEGSQGRHAFRETAQPAGTAQDQATNGVAATHAEAHDPAATSSPSPPGHSPASEPVPGWALAQLGASAPAGLGEPVEGLRNGASLPPWAGPGARPAEPSDPLEPTRLRVPAYTGFTPLHRARPATSQPPATPSQPSATNPYATNLHATNLDASDPEAQTLPTGLAIEATLAALGWSQPLPLELADADGPTQVGEPTATPAGQDHTCATSVPPGPDGSSPSEQYTIKGNEGSGRFHTLDSPYYVRTRADAWFRTTEDAERAGFTPWNHRRS